MRVRHRPMRAADVHECVELIAQDPIMSVRYGPLLQHLPKVWLRLLGKEAFRAWVFPLAHPQNHKLIALGASAVVSDAFVARLKRPTFVWIGPELVSRILQGDSPLLSDQQVAEVNASNGLNLLMWGTTVRQEHNGADWRNNAFAAFLEVHEGFYVKESLIQAESEMQVEGLLNVGGLCVAGNDGVYAAQSAGNVRDLAHKPHIIGMTRELIARQPGRWISNLFACERQRIGFTRGQQRLLLAAMEGGTDVDLANELGVSISAVKKTWQAIYHRVMERTPDILPAGDDRGNQRGKAKKHRLLSYLRVHTEELRPGRVSAWQSKAAGA